MEVLNYIPLAITIVGSLLSVGTVYGVLSSRVRELSDRVRDLEIRNDALPALSERTARIEEQLKMVVSLLQKPSMN